MLPYNEMMQALRKKRKRLDLQQKVVANRVGISPSQLNRMENNTSQARYETVYKVWRYLNRQEDAGETAEEVMYTDILWVGPGDTCLTAKTYMKKNDYSQLPVKQDGEQVGSIHAEDLLDITDPDTPVREVMDEPFIEIRPDTRRKTIVELLKDGNQALLVTKKDDYLGIITKADII